ncbi:SDR family oxidoreductase [Myxococcus stipitatus]|uniref:SDR family oxidoreductase n=1 Tax=Myxococcus stipitatus TaxID=83455 RepID=UPI001F1AC604|nr:SDR family oxidoreductase [Myxococcus stipitatus]MCE9671359.1 SDR family oxidoreductase [Myxococcus stipitatus]
MRQLESPPLTAADTLEGRTFLLTGATGFLGQAVLSHALRELPTARFKLLIRDGKRESAAERLEGKVRDSAAFEPARRQCGKEFFEADFQRRVSVVSGDLSKEGLGIREPRHVMAGVDLVIHCAADVEFHPPLDRALELNTLGPLRVLELTRHMASPRMLHVSTNFVAGTRTGRVAEPEDPRGEYPRARTLNLPFDAKQELEDCLSLIRRVEAELGDQLHEARLRERVGVDASESAVRRERRRGLDARLTTEGTQRAQFWGWPNTYLYTKAMGEQLLLAHAAQTRCAIARTAILSPAEALPVPGWHQGTPPLTPVARMIREGLRVLPGNPRLILDVLPVDHAAAGVLQVAMALLGGQARTVYHVGSSGSNPLTLARLLQGVSDAVRATTPRGPGARGVVEALEAALPVMALPRQAYEVLGVPSAQKAIGILSRLLPSLPGLQPRRRAEVRSRLKRKLREMDYAKRVIDVSLPFMHDYSYEFQTDNLVALRASLPPGERVRFPFEPERIDWDRYVRDVFVPAACPPAESVR